MLVLSRTVGKTIFIGDDIEITLIGIERNQARIGIKAPDHINIMREELLAPGERPQRERQTQK